MKKEKTEGEAGWMSGGHVDHNRKPRDTVKNNKAYKCSIWYQNI